MELRDIHRTIDIKATPHEIYECLMDSEKHAQFSKEPASISREIGGKFTAYGDHLSGTNIELIPDQKIVQNWRAKPWPEGHHSVVAYRLEKTPDGTRLHFSQTGIPATAFESISKGWQTYYWEPIKELLEK